MALSIIIFLIVWLTVLAFVVSLTPGGSLPLLWRESESRKNRKYAIFVFCLFVALSILFWPYTTGFLEAIFSFLWGTMFMSVLKAVWKSVPAGLYFIKLIIVVFAVWPAVILTVLFVLSLGFFARLICLLGLLIQRALLFSRKATIK
jgi:hypothetical protein